MSTNTPEQQAETYARALELAAGGCSVIPVADDGTKRPALASWRAHMDTAAEPELLAAWFAPRADGSPAPHGGLGVVCGSVSGDLLMVEAEADAAEAAGQLRTLAEASGLVGVWDAVVGGWCERSPAGGVHVFLRCTEPVGGNVKLARGADGRQTLAETRGEGGFTVTAGTPGRFHASGRAWERLTGGPATAAVLTPAELEAFLALWRTLDLAPHPEALAETVAEPTSATAAFLAGAGPGAPGEAGELTPGDDYERRTTWAQLLLPEGWTRVYTAGRTTYWRRPGKDRGVSATTGHAEDRDRLYVFSSSTEFPTETPLTMFHVYALLHHGGDHREAARDLRRQGYGTDRPQRVAASPEQNAELAAEQRSRHLAVVPRAEGTSALDADAQPATAGETAAAPAATTRPRAAGPRKYDVRLTDSGNAEAFAAAHGEGVRYVVESGEWLLWRPDAGTLRNRWVRDAGALQSTELLRTMLQQLAAEAGEEDERKHLQRSLGRRSVADALTLARGLPGVAVSIDGLDADPLLLGTPAGVVDLRTGVLRPADAAELVTRATAVTPDASCPTPRWDAFLERMFSGDPERIGYVQRLMGYALSGLVSWHTLPFLHGPGANGKSVLANTLRLILGDYATAAPAHFLMAGMQQHETELARLRGLRLVVASEIDSHARMDEAKIKTLTGGDAITARFMRQDHFTFQPTHKLWLLGNHLPRVEVGGESFWRRLRLLNCGLVVPAEERIPDLDRLLVDTEGPGILAWALAGLADLLARQSLAEPASVLQSTADYAAEESGFDTFVAESLLIGGGEHVRVETGVLRMAYQRWCEEEGMQPLGTIALGRELRGRGIGKAEPGRRKFYTNVALREGPAEHARRDDYSGGTWPQ